MSTSVSPWLAWLILLAGVVGTGCSFIFIRESIEPPIMLAAWRVLLAALMLSPVYLLTRRTHGDVPAMQVLQRSMLPGLVLASHLVTWVIGARLSLGANATIIVNLVPLAMPVLMWLMFKERLQRHEKTATLLAMSGLGILAIDNLNLASDRLAGDAICLLSMWLFALYLALARRHRDIPSIWLYIVPVYFVAACASLLAAPWFGPVVPALEVHNLLMVLGLAGVSTVLGHSALNFAMRHMAAQSVGVMTLAQFIIAGILAYLIYDEIPSLLFYPASALMVAGMLLIVLGSPDSTGPGRSEV